MAVAFFPALILRLKGILSALLSILFCFSIKGRRPLPELALYSSDSRTSIGSVSLDEFDDDESPPWQSLSEDLLEDLFVPL